MPTRPSLTVSLSALRAFETVARLGGLAPAASELGLTVSALSHQLRSLESSMRVRLFEKQGRRALPTTAGARLAGALTQPFAAIDDELAQALSARPMMTVSVHDTFAIHWLLPRLRKFAQSHPELDLRLATTSRLVDLERERIDCAIRLGPGDWPNVTARPLVAQQIGPVVRADRSWQSGPPRIVQDGAAAEWNHWPCRTKYPQEITVQSRELVIAAALAGSGIGLVDLILLSDHLASGHLSLVDAPLITDWCYHLVLPQAQSTPRHVREFADWLAEEMAQTGCLIPTILRTGRRDP